MTTRDRIKAQLNSQLNAPNVWELNVPLSAIDEAAALFKEGCLEARCAEFLAGNDWHMRLRTASGNFFAMRTNKPGSKGGWRSDLVWISVDDQATYTVFDGIFMKLGLEHHLASFCDCKRLRLYSAFFVVRTTCHGAHFHTDWADQVGCNAFTLMTPLEDYPIAPDASGQFQLLYHDYEHSFDITAEGAAEDAGVRRYVYHKGKAIVFGAHFSHSTEPGRSASIDAPQVYLCFTFGSDKTEHWPGIFESCGYQARVLARHDGQLVEGILPGVAVTIDDAVASHVGLSISSIERDSAGQHWLHSPQQYFAWLRKAGVQWNVKLAFSKVGSGDVCILSNGGQPTRQGHEIASIPQSAMLSVATSSVAHVLEQLSQLGASAYAMLALAVAYERSLGPTSWWSPYLATVPDTEPLPLTWTEEELTGLCGTGLDTTARTRRRDLASDFRQLQVALQTLEAPPGSDSDAATAFCQTCAKVSSAVSEEAYVRAATLAWSRAFHLGGGRGEALVPLADLLNHKCALRGGGEAADDDAEGDGGSSDDEDDDDEGDVGSSDDDDEDAEDGGDDEGERVVGAQRIQTTAFMVDHDARYVNELQRDVAQRAADLIGLDLGLEVGHRFSDPEPPSSTPQLAQDSGGRFALIAMRRFEANVEVSHSYGELSNWSLLSDYGFTLADNPFDAATLSWEAITTALAVILVRKQECSHATAATSVKRAVSELIGMPGGSLFVASGSSTHLYDREGETPADLAMALQLVISQLEIFPKSLQHSTVAAQVAMDMADNNRRWRTSGEQVALAIKSVREGMATGDTEAWLAARSFRSLAHGTRLASLIREGATDVWLSAKAVLLEAMWARLGSYASALAAPAINDAGVSAARAVQSAQLVASEIAIWKSAVAVLLAV